jgi:hypothetical protein
LADGHIQDNRLTVVLSIKDKDHLEKMALFLGTNVSYSDTFCRLSIKHSALIPLLVSKFNIDRRKTYNPPNFKIESDELFLSMLAGFIDGDGCISKQTGRQDCILSIKLHKSWEFLLEEWLNRFLSIFNIEKYNSLIKNVTKIHTTKCGRYIRSSNSNSELLYKFKLFCIDKHLPILSRKWDRIVECSNKYKNASIKRKRLFEMLQQGYTRKSICESLNVSVSYISMNIKRHKKHEF